MNLKATLIAAGVAIVACWIWGQWQYHSGWNEGRANLVAEQQTKQQQQIAKQIAQQQADNQKATEAKEAGEKESESIQKEYENYVSRADRRDRQFDADRVRIKSRAVENAASIPGFDD